MVRAPMIMFGPIVKNLLSRCKNRAGPVRLTKDVALRSEALHDLYKTVDFNGLEGRPGRYRGP